MPLMIAPNPDWSCAEGVHPGSFGSDATKLSKRLVCDRGMTVRGTAESRKGSRFFCDVREAGGGVVFS